MYNVYYILLDILASGKLDVLEVFDSVSLDYYNTTDQGEENQWVSFTLKNMRERKMMIETRPRYPSDQLTFTVAHIMKHKAVRYFDIELNLNERFDVGLVLQDYQRNFPNSFILYLLHFY